MINVIFYVKPYRSKQPACFNNWESQERSKTKDVIFAFFTIRFFCDSFYRCQSPFDTPHTDCCEGKKRIRILFFVRLVFFRQRSGCGYIAWQFEEWRPYFGDYVRLPRNTRSDPAFRCHRWPRRIGVCRFCGREPSPERMFFFKCVYDLCIKPDKNFRNPNLEVSVGGAKGPGLWSFSHSFATGHHYTTAPKKPKKFITVSFSLNLSLPLSLLLSLYCVFPIHWNLDNSSFFNSYLDDRVLNN